MTEQQKSDALNTLDRSSRELTELHGKFSRGSDVHAYLMYAIQDIRRATEALKRSRVDGPQSDKDLTDAAREGAYGKEEKK